MDIKRFEAENTVSAVNQLKNTFSGSDNHGGLRILFVGNSITLHGPKSDIGWNNNWGMAASSEEKDYVHLVMKHVRTLHPDADMRIAQAAAWEREYWLGEKVLAQFAEAQAWQPDIVIVRLGENTPDSMLGEHPYAPAFADMVNFFSNHGKAKVLITELFWPNPEKEAEISKAAAMLGLSLIPLNDLGMRDDMKAIGLFEHSGVAAHPGDLGMATIAERIFEKLKKWL